MAGRKFVEKLSTYLTSGFPGEHFIVLKCILSKVRKANNELELS